MTITLFVAILTIGSFLCTALTQAVKTWFYNAGKDASPNVLAMINAIVIGGLGTAVVYILIGIPWTLNNVICLICMVFMVWLGSMIGFDKVKQLIEQLAPVIPEKKDKE